MAETVTIDRAVAMDILIEVYAIATIFEALGGVSPPHATEGLERSVHPLAKAVYPDDDAGSEIFGEAAEQRAREIVGFLGGSVQA